MYSTYSVNIFLVDYYNKFHFSQAIIHPRFLEGVIFFLLEIPEIACSGFLEQSLYISSICNIYIYTSISMNLGTAYVRTPCFMQQRFRSLCEKVDVIIYIIYTQLALFAVELMTIYPPHCILHLKNSSFR